MLEFIKSIFLRAKGNPKTTIGGGIFGVILVGIIEMLENQTGCHFVEAFAGIDVAQILAFAISQAFGLLVTDANKTLQKVDEKVVVKTHVDAVNTVPIAP